VGINLDVHRRGCGKKRHKKRIPTYLSRCSEKEKSWQKNPPYRGKTCHIGKGGKVA